MGHNAEKGQHAQDELKGSYDVKVVLIAWVELSKLDDYRHYAMTQHHN